MKRQLGFLFAVLCSLFFVSGATYAQLLAQPKPCRLRIQVTDDRQRKLPDLTVEVQDAVGFAAAGTTKQTDQDGRVDFNTYTGVHRIRITGGEILDYEGDFEIAPSESSHTENIRVKMKAPVGGDNPAPGTPVPATRLKIPGPAQKEYEKGNKSSEKSDWKAATEHYNQAIQLYPDYDLAYNALGVALSSQNDAAGAKAAFEKAISITPEYAMAGRNLARILLADKDWKGAETLLRKSLQIEPVNAWAQMSLAYAELELHEYDAAAADAQKVHAIPHAGFENAHFIAAVALERLGNKDSAKAEYDLYIKEAPTGPNAIRARESLARLAQP